MSLPPPASGVQNIVYFGDSLTDDGNLFSVTDGVINDSVRNSFGSPTGEISNGPVHSEYTPELLGIEDSTYNYAVAGARAIGSYTLGQFIADHDYTDALLVPADDPQLAFDINLAAQVDRFEADFSGQDLDDFTAFILIGGNDFSDIPLDDPLLAVPVAIETIFGVVGETLGAALELNQQGVGAVEISTLPVSSFFPADAALDPIFQALSNLVFSAANALLTLGAEALSSHGFDIGIFDTTAITAAIVDDPSAFGLIAPYTDTLTGDPALLDQYDPDQIAFYDSIHPTTATHGVIGAYVAYGLENEATVLDDGANLAVTGAANDLVMAYAGNDLIATGGGDDLGFGGTGSDILFGGAQNDLLSGGSDNDRLIGGEGQDTLDGDEGNDLLVGGCGDDVLIDGTGADRMFAGGGDDVFIYTQPELIGGTGPEPDLIVGGTGQDTLYLVLDDATSAQISADLSGPDPQAALQSLGLTVAGVEDIVVLTGRDALSSLSGNDWYGDADIWGLI